MVWEMPGGALIGINSSGNSKDVLYARYVAKSKGLKTLALAGCKGGKMEENFDMVKYHQIVL